MAKCVKGVFVRSSHLTRLRPCGTEIVDDNHGTTVKKWNEDHKGDEDAILHGDDGFICARCLRSMMPK